MELKLLTRLRLGLSGISMNIELIIIFQSCLNALCSCSLQIESTTYFLLHCHHFSNIASTFLNITNLSESKTNTIKSKIW